MPFPDIVRLCDSGAFDQAEVALRAQLQSDPETTELYTLLGIVLSQSGRPGEAMEAYSKAISLDECAVDAINNLGLLLLEAGELDAARARCQEAVQLAPDRAGFHYNLGLVYALSSDHQRAIQAYEDATRIDPQLAEAFYNLGCSRAALGSATAAVEAFTHSIRLAPDNPDAHNNCGNAYFRLGDLEAAEASYRTALSLNPDSADATSNLGNVFRDIYRADQADACYQRAMALAPQHAGVRSNRAMASLYTDEIDATTRLEIHREIDAVKRARGIVGRTDHRNRKAPDRRLRIGYLSKDLREHSVARFLLPVIETHNRETFEVFCYYNSHVYDATTRRFMEESNFKSIVDVDDDAAEKILVDDAIDILVDLSGHTDGNRLMLFARKPAPIQISWLGYNATTGLDEMDYRLVDHRTDPVGATEDLNTETLLRLPNHLGVFAADSAAPPISPPPSSRTRTMTFGSFNNANKISDHVVQLWAQILHRIPHSKLLLKSRSLESSLGDLIYARFAQHGVPADRLLLLGRDPQATEHLRNYGRIDIALDCFPYNGVTTTIEALTMGVPVVTLVGRNAHSRMGFSILDSIRQDRLIAFDDEQYVDAAVRLANRPVELAGLRAQLPRLVAKSPLVDAPLFTSHLERIYRQVWHAYCFEA